MRPLITIIGVLGVLTAFLALDDVLVTVIYATFGIGVLLAPIGTIPYYLIGILPLVGLRRVLPWLAIGSSAVLLAIFAFGPAVIGQLRLRTLIDATVLVRAAALPDDIGSIELRDSARLANDEDACGVLCRSLLLSGRAETFRFVDIGGRNRETSAFFRRFSGSRCAADADTVCVLPAWDAGEPPKLRLTFSSSTPDARPGVRPAVRHSSALRSVRGTFNDGSGYTRLVLERTELQTHVPLSPAIVVNGVGPGLNSGGVGFRHRTVTFGEVSPESAAKALGLPFDPSNARPERRRNEGIDTQVTRNVLAVLGLPSQGAFEGAYATYIRKWLLAARNEERWTQERLDILERIVRDPRIPSYGFELRILFERSRAVRERLVPVIFDVIEKDGLGSETVTMWLVRSLTAAERDLLTPYADRIATLASTPGSYQQSFRELLSQAGVDPTPFLTPFRFGSGSDVNERIRTACRAREEWGSKLLPHLLDAVETAPYLSGSERGRHPYVRYREALAASLFAFGEDEVASGLVEMDDRRTAELARARNLGGDRPCRVLR